MSTQVQYRRGTGAQNNSFTGALGEITVDTTNWTLRIHNGSTAGGAGNLATVAYVDASISSLSSNSISFGTSSVAVISSGGNVRTNVGGSTITTVYSGGIVIAGGVNANGNIYLNNGTSNLHLPASNGNVHFTVGGNAIIRVTSQGIVNDMGNGVGNIGNSSAYFNTVFAKATSAQYADVAEKYLADQYYDPGTVMEIGGPAEVQASQEYASPRIAGVVSTNPALIMNSGESGKNAVEIALIGRVPCRVIGPIRRGDLLGASCLIGVATSLKPEDYRPGSVIGKALQDHDSDQEGVIEVLVGRL